MGATEGICIRVLGPVRVVGSPLDLAPKQQLLLGALALRRGTHAVGELSSVLWRDREPGNPRAALHVLVSKVRRALAQCDVRIVRDGDGYILRGAEGRIDVDAFEERARLGLGLVESDSAGAHEALTAALDLWRGSPLGGLGSETSLAGDIARLEDLRLAVIRGRMASEIALRRFDEAISELRRQTHENPLHEVFWHQLMEALTGAGRVGEALAAYAEVRHVLRDELGTDPGADIAELYDRLLHQAERAAVASTPSRSERVAPPADSIVVLPFSVLGDEHGVGLLADGLHMDLLAELAHVPGLTVISRHSALASSRVGASITDISRELGVALAVTGSLRVERSRFRLTVHLVDAETGVQRWAESYDHELSPHSVLRVQHDLAADIARSLARRALPASSLVPSSLEAYRLVVEGRLHFDRKTETGLADAVNCFERAVAEDPAYGEAWAGLADALAMNADYGYGEREDLITRAECAVDEAVASGADPAMIHASRGLIAESRSDAPRALHEYERAIAAAPAHADAHSWRAWVSLVIGETEQGFISARRSVQLNPLSAEAVTNLALAHLARGDPTSALEESRRAGTLSPSYTTAKYYEGIALYDLGRFREAGDVLRALSTMRAGHLTTPWAGMAPDAAFALSLCACGDAEGARDVLARIDGGHYPVEEGLVRLALGDLRGASTAFARDVPLGYGACLLLHHHFRSVWDAMGQGDVRDRLVDRAHRSWKVGGDEVALG